MKTETQREIAKRVAHDWKKNHFISALNMRMDNLAEAIEAALKDRDERAAKIAETYYSSSGQYIAEKIRGTKCRLRNRSRTQL